VHQVTLTVTADTLTVKRILALLEENPTNPSPVRDDQLREFLSKLNNPCWEVVQTIAGWSLKGDAISRAALLRAVTLSANAGGKAFEQEAQLTGVLGAIGKWWAQFMRQPNPFVGRRSSASAEPDFLIDSELAARILEIMKAHADAWRRQWHASVS
jgi:hypothetical protein